jgi:hypothetical protein
MFGSCRSGPITTLCCLIRDWPGYAYGHWVLTRLFKIQIHRFCTTIGQSDSLSWYQTTIWDLRPIFVYFPWKLFLDRCAFYCGGAPYNEGMIMGCWPFLGSDSRGTHDHVLLSEFWGCHNLEGQVPVFIVTRNRIAQFHPQALSLSDKFTWHIHSFVYTIYVPDFSQCSISDLCPINSGYGYNGIFIHMIGHVLDRHQV